MEVWKVKILAGISKVNWYFFAYFMAKLQFPSIEMCVSILNKAENYLYLFELESYKKFDPKNCEIRTELLNLYVTKKKSF